MSLEKRFFRSLAKLAWPIAILGLPPGWCDILTPACKFCGSVERQEMGAADAGLAESTSVLRGPAKPILDGVLSGASVPWFGSGISRERFPDVPTLILELLRRLFQSADTANPACPYLRTISDVLNLAYGCTLDPKVDPDLWDADSRRTTLGILAGQYAAVLAMNINTAAGARSVRWDVLNLIATYSDPAVEPDAEHDFIALLAREGAWSDLVTTNWDALIEKADANSSNGGDPLHSIACNEEFDIARNGASCRLFKIHGCAKKAAANPGRYRPFMIATDLELGRWTADEQYRPFREALSTMLRERPVLFIGLSGQDFNLKVQLITATLGRHPFDPAIPRIAFSGATITPHHRTILTAFYTEAVFAASQEAISQAALVPLYGKPLLGAIYFEMMLAKCEAALDRSNGDLRPVSVANTRTVLNEIRTAAIREYDNRIPAVASDDMWRQFAAEIPRLMSRVVLIYRSQVKLPSDRAYAPLYVGTLSKLRADGNLPQMAFHWLLWAVALLVEGARRGLWILQVDLNGADPASPLAVTIGTRTRPVFMISDQVQGSTKLAANDLITATNENLSVVIYPSGRKPARRARMPGRILSVRGSASALAEIWLGDLCDSTASDDEVLELLKMEVA